jgi:hypothetical protein
VHVLNIILPPFRHLHLTYQGTKVSIVQLWIVLKMIEAVVGVEIVVNTVKLLLETGQFSDLTLVCQNKRFLVHRGIVCSRSPVWAAATEGKFKVRMTF